MNIPHFKSLHAKQPGTISLDKVVDLIKNDTGIKGQTLKARKCYGKGEKLQGDYVKKNLLPAFAPCAILDGGKSKDHIIDLTGICFLDIDHITGEEAKYAQEMLASDPHILLACISVSGKGIHLLVRYTVDFGAGNLVFISTPARLRKLYRKVFLTLAAAYTEKLGIQVDMSGTNADRLCLISHDPSIYYNPDCIPLEVKMT